MLSLALSRTLIAGRWPLRRRQAKRHDHSDDQDDCKYADAEHSAQYIALGSAIMVSKRRALARLGLTAGDRLAEFDIELRRINASTKGLRARKRTVLAEYRKELQRAVESYHRA
jgi:hypothetical protein